MPRLSRTGVSPNETAIAGSAVAITVPSRFSMNRAQATVSATTIGRETKASIGRCYRTARRLCQCRDTRIHVILGLRSGPAWPQLWAAGSRHLRQLLEISDLGVDRVLNMGDLFLAQMA